MSDEPKAKIVQIAVDEGRLYILTSSGRIAFTELDGNSAKSDKWRSVDLPKLGANLFDSAGRIIEVPSETKAEN